MAADVALKASFVLLVAVLTLSGCGAADHTAAQSTTTSVSSSSSVAPTTPTTAATSAPATSTTTTPSSTTVTATGVAGGVRKTFSYNIQTKGTVRTNVDDFAASVASTLSDPRGWPMGGQVAFKRVSSGGDMTIWMSAASELPSFSSICSVEYSCSVGRNVVLNDERWVNGGKLDMPLAAYRQMVVNHEVGHFLGLDHRTCPGAGQPAYVMQQQSKGGTFLGACTPNAWPLASERQLVEQRYKLATY